MLRLNKEETLVLFEFCHRICETEKVAASHHAEIVVLDKIAGELERTLSEPFLDEYSDILATARNTILNSYRKQMDKHGWVENVQLMQE